MIRTATVAAVGLFLVVAFVLLGVPAITTMASGNPSVADSVGVGGCGAGGTGQTVANVALDAEQFANGATIVSVTAGRGLPPYAATIALATAMQESTLHNITTAVDHDSLGLFQQRAVFYPAAVAADPVKATGAFLDRLLVQPHWQTRPLTDVAADVQQPLAAYRGRYAQWQTIAAQLTALLWTGPTSTAHTSIGKTGGTSPGATGKATSGARAAASSCPGSAGTNSNATHTPGPNSLTLTGSPAGNAAATYALAQLGKPYVWGAQGPTSFDCSGLTMAAWASAGTTIPRVTTNQATAGTPVPVQDARTGDLVLIPGSDGTAAQPGHVAIVTGRDAAGALWLVEAARTGIPVRSTPISNWAGQIVTIRRIG